jgi:uncharacterized Zn-binding protein involved in type VI secretion
VVGRVGYLNAVPFPILNTNAIVTCVHGGKVMLIPKLPTVTIGGAPVLRLGDLRLSPTTGPPPCPVAPSPGSKPCTMVVDDPIAWAQPTVLVGGQPVLVQKGPPGGTTDGVPPAPMMGLMCTFAGQATVMA